jgi:hypothetical protein
LKTPELRSPEFKRDPQTAQAKVTAEVLECPGDGSPGDGGPGKAELCLQNPSFEGTHSADARGQLTRFEAA